MAIAASLFVAVGLGAVAYHSWNWGGGHDHLAVDFDRYLEEFPERPEVAQQILLANYEGRSISMAEATNVLGYEPLAAKGLPAGYSVKEVHLLKMPCCTCAQVVCTSPMGHSIAIFEHAIDQPIWFGDRPSRKCLCHEVPTEIKSVGDQLAATWKQGTRFVTLIGATDEEEVSEFVASFKAKSSS